MREGIERPMRVLIAEDTGTSRLALERTLSKWGYDVISCNDGLSAWEQLQKPGAPQLAILDWMMPGFSGPDICRMVRKAAAEPYTYILLLTSRTLKQDIVEGMEAGADDYVTKPFDQHELHVRLRAGMRILELQAELVKAREALRDQAMRDPLTGLWNRRSILEMLDLEQARARREKSSIGVIMLDLDHFKLINDSYGHPAGDEVLREAARRLRGSVRPYDGVGRYGGEEFLVVLPGCDPTAVEGRAEAIRHSIAAEPVIFDDAALLVTASFGSTVFASEHQITSAELIRAADEALYLAKQDGRNCVRFRAVRSDGLPMDPYPLTTP